MWGVEMCRIHKKNPFTVWCAVQDHWEQKEYCPFSVACCEWAIKLTQHLSSHKQWTRSSWSELLRQQHCESWHCSYCETLHTVSSYVQNQVLHSILQTHNINLHSPNKMRLDYSISCCSFLFCFVLNQPFLNLSCEKRQYTKGGHSWSWRGSDMHGFILLQLRHTWR